MVRSILAVALPLFPAGPVCVNPEPSDGTSFYGLIPVDRVNLYYRVDVTALEQPS